MEFRMDESRVIIPCRRDVIYPDPSLSDMQATTTIYLPGVSIVHRPVS